MKHFLYFISLLFILAIPVRAESTLVLAKVENTLDQTVSAEILKIAYEKIGISVEIRGMPPKRSLQETNEGKVDGEVSRVIDVSKLYPKLIRVPTSINVIKPSVFSKNLNFTVTDCEALKNYSVAIVSGAKFAELCIQGMPYVYVTVNLSQAIRLLIRDRVDIVIATEGNGSREIKDQGIESIRLLSPALKTMPLYHYLNPKHEVLAVQIGEVLAKMKQSGELEKLRIQILKRLNNE